MTKKSRVKRVSHKKISSVQAHTVTQTPQGIDRVVHFVVSVFFRFLLYFFVFLLGAIFTVIVSIGLVASVYLRTISGTSGISVQRLLSIGMKSRDQAILDQDGRYTVLVLGTDALANRDSQSKLTDTIMVISARPAKGKIDTFSIPRDLWIASESSKINGLYTKDNSLPLKTVQNITGIPIQKQVVIDIATVGKMIDAIGGLDITVERSFVDYRFPRSDVDVRVVHDPNLLYETVAFSKGTEHMSGDRALRYIRSRHSPDVVEGTDDARVRRQQQVISAMLTKLRDPLLIRNPEEIGTMLKLYEADVQSTLSLEDAAALMWQFAAHKSFPEFTAHQFTIKEVDAHGQLTHPDRFAGGAWVYLPVDPSYTQIKQTVTQWLSQ